MGTFEINVAGIDGRSHSGTISPKIEDRGWLRADAKDTYLILFYNLFPDGLISIEARGPKNRHDVLAVFSFDSLPENGDEVKADRMRNLCNKNDLVCTMRKINPK